MKSVRVLIYEAFLFLFYFSLLYLKGVFNKIIKLLAIVGNETTIAHSALSTLWLLIYLKYPSNREIMSRRGKECRLPKPIKAFHRHEAMDESPWPLQFGFKPLHMHFSYCRQRIQQINTDFLSNPD